MEENKDLDIIIGQNLLKLRKNMKLTQMEVAEKFNYSDKSISKWEKGESLPSIEVLCKLAKFYGVGLDDLTKENDLNPIPHSQNKHQKPPHKFSPKIMITLLSIGAVGLIATVLFVMLKIFANIDYFMVFLWAGVASTIILIIFNSIWGKITFLFPILTIMLWLSLASIHLQVLIPSGVNIWPIYFLGVPLQILILLWHGLTKREKLPKDLNKPKN